MTDNEKLEIVVRRIEEGGIDVAPSFSEYQQLFFALANIGEQGRDYLHRVCRLHPNYSAEDCNKHFDNVLKTSLGRVSIGTFYQLCKDHGVDVSMPLGRPRKSKEEKREDTANKMQKAIDHIKGQYQLRHNVWTDRTEMMEEGKWHPVNERDVDTIYCKMKLEGISLNKTDILSILNSKHVVNDYDAVNIWLDSLPAWQPHEGDDIENEVFKDDPIAEFFGHIKIANEQERDVCIHFMRKWFVGLVGMMSGQISEHNLMLVLVGEQHKGKTYFVRHILPPELSDYLYQANPSTKVDKDFIISLSEFALIFLDEFSFGNNAKSDACKYVVTSTISNERDAYGHFRERRERRAALIAAANETHFIKDIQGSRRYFPIEMVGYVDFHEVPLQYERAYAMALYLLRHGYSSKPTAQESEFITQRNMNYIEPDDVTELISSFFRKPMEEERCMAWTAGQILQELGNMGFRSNKYNAYAISRALAFLGYDAYKRHNQNHYLIVKEDPERLEINRKFEGEMILDMINREKAQEQ